MNDIKRSWKALKKKDICVHHVIANLTGKKRMILSFECKIKINRLEELRNTFLYGMYM